jgi:CDP-glucose 4,6-dehydratase
MFHNRRVLVTGHTGFKGSWLTLWLQQLGANVTAIALAPESEPNHWDLLRLNLEDHRIDLRDTNAVSQVVRSARPELVFHLAAQSLVRRSYQDPIGTWSTNIMGTANLLNACRDSAGLRAIVVVTSDKCYASREWVWAYRETDAIGGIDPYSASKAATELLVDSYRSSFFARNSGPALATARAGNVIGGGDWSKDRLIPDVVRASTAGKPIEVRYPDATRPWQHVLESISGYLLLSWRLSEGGVEFAEAWNFGPVSEGDRTVSDVLNCLRQQWPAVKWKASSSDKPHESSELRLDSSKARQRLGWCPIWGFEEALRMTGQWYHAFLRAGEVYSREQLEAYITAAAEAGAIWCET